MDADAIAEAYNVSVQMATFRLRTTAVVRQLEAERAKH